MKKIMKNLKKIPTLLMLVLSIVMSVPMNVFAEEKEWFEEPGTATVNVSIDEKYADMTVSAYRIIDVNIDETAKQPANPVYTWRSELVSFVEGYQEGKFIGEGNAVSGDFCKPNTTGCNLTDGEVAKFYDALAKEIRSKSLISADKTVDGAADDVSMELGMGNYLVLIEKGVNIYTPSAVNVVPEFNKTDKKWEVKVEGAYGANDVRIKPKYTTPSITKEVEDEAAFGNEIGKEHNYKITVAIPQYPDNAINKKFYIADKFSEGLTLDETSIVVKADGEELTKDTDYTLAVAPNATLNDEAKTFVVSFSNAQYESALTTTNPAGETVIKQTLTVEYKGIINEKAVAGTTETNEAILKYANDPYKDDDYNTTDPETVEVYTYGIKLTKTDAKTGEAIEVEDPEKRAEFTISDSQGNPIEFVSTGDGEYRKAILAEVKDETGKVILAKDDNTVTKLVVSADGILTVTGLDQGTYTAVETRAPEGYIKSTETYTITVTDTGASSTLTGKVTDDANDNDDAYADKEIPNSNEMPALPVTGGIGTILFSVIGIVFMGLGAFLIKNILKKEDVQ